MTAGGVRIVRSKLIACKVLSMQAPASASRTDTGRWIDVASWSGVELVPGIDFPDIALPEHEPSGARRLLERQGGVTARRDRRLLSA
jgi:hypothetical protein